MQLWLKSLLCSLFLVSLPRCSLSADCSAPARERAVQAILVSWPGLAMRAGGVINRGADNRSVTDLPEAASSDVCPPGSEAAPANSSFPAEGLLPPPSDRGPDQPSSTGSNPAKASANSVETVRTNSPADRNREIYYRNRLEFAFDLGTLPINIPFPFDFMEGDPYIQHPIRYTLIPILASLRWQISNIGGPWIFRGNWDLTSSGSFTWIPSGPETRFISYDMGLRRNFVPHNRNFAPYFDIRLGVGQINAKGPKGVPYAQGENWPEFAMNMGTGVRYNFSSRFAFSGGLNYMHLSNMDLSEHKPTATDPNWGPINYGINVYGPMLGIDMRLGRSHRE